MARREWRLTVSNGSITSANFAFRMMPDFYTAPSVLDASAAFMPIHILQMLHRKQNNRGRQPFAALAFADHSVADLTSTSCFIKAVDFASVLLVSEDRV